jgi:hypothetical protein
VAEYFRLYGGEFSLNAVQHFAKLSKKEEWKRRGMVKKNFF